MLMIVKDKNKFFIKDSRLGRLYCRKFNDRVIEYPSVTSIISKTDETFSNKTSPSASIGTIVHFHILKKYSKEVLDIPNVSVYGIPREETLQRINRCVSMWNSINIKIDPILVETAVFSNKPCYAGRIDMLCKVDGKLTLLDIKTGKEYDNHVIQAAAYWNALNRKPDVLFIYLDGIIGRNPEQLPTLKYFVYSELEKGYDEFINRYIKLCGLNEVQV